MAAAVPSEGQYQWAAPRVAPGAEAGSDRPLGCISCGHYQKERRNSQGIPEPGQFILSSHDDHFLLNFEPEIGQTHFIL